MLGFFFFFKNNSNEVSFLSYLILQPTYQKKKTPTNVKAQHWHLGLGLSMNLQSLRPTPTSPMGTAQPPCFMHSFLLIKYKLHPNSFLTFSLKYLLISFAKIGFEFNPIYLVILNFYYWELCFGESCTKWISLSLLG